MALQVSHGTDLPEWELWGPDPGEPSYSANFYTPTEPFQRRRVTITHMKLAEQAEAGERERGFVPLPELPEAVVVMWAERDVNWLIGSVLKHLEGRDASV